MSNRMHRTLLERTLRQTLKDMQLRALKRVHFKFDPFHPSTASVRDVLFHFNSERLRLTNPGCNMKTEVVSDRSAPQVDLRLNEGKRYRILTENLTTLEIIQQVDRICREFDPKKDEQSGT